MKVEYKAIFKLKIMLDNAEIPYEFLDRSFIDYKEHTLQYPFYQIIVYEPNQEDIEEPIRLISVIQGHGTYGESQDLLEIRGCLTNEERNKDGVVGCLSVYEVFKRIKKNYRNSNHAKTFELIEEDKKIEKLIIGKDDVAWCEGNMKTDEEMVDIVLEIKDKINEIIDYIMEDKHD